jgi:Fe2+ or Zn2+ uptake regulation protein
MPDETDRSPLPNARDEAGWTDDAIRASGLRRTVPRNGVAEALRRHPGHHTVGELQTLIAAEAPEATGIARSSVYRALDSLERAGLVVSIRAGQEEARFEWAATPHHHLICDGCGHVSEVALDAAEALEREARTGHGFTTRVRHLTLRGWCGGCASTRGGATGRTSP